MTRFVVPALVLSLTAVAWAADVVTIEDWKAAKLGAKGIPEGWLGGQTWGLPQHDFAIEENDGHRVLQPGRFADFDEAICLAHRVA